MYERFKSMYMISYNMFPKQITMPAVAHTVSDQRLKFNGQRAAVKGQYAKDAWKSTKGEHEIKRLTLR